MDNMYSRRDVLRALGTFAAAGRVAGVEAAELNHRVLGRTGRWVTPFALGGQASLERTGPGIDRPDIIVRAVELGVNYLDSANAYGPSQSYYGEAFRRINLAPGAPGYNAALRERLFIATKTTRRFSRDASGAATAISDLKQSLTVMFGDGKGSIPDGAYLDLFQIHNLTTTAGDPMRQVDQIYEGLDRRDDPSLPRLGALAGLLDFRDGTNVTGLNPEKRRWIRHIGITGHQNSPLLMYALQRDSLNIIDTLLVALNANDRRYLCHQYNVLPVAAARGVGVIAMKVFARAEMFGHSRNDVLMSVGAPGAVSHADLLRYALSLPGVSCAVAGIGAIDRENPAADQVVANVAAGQMPPLEIPELRRIEDELAQRNETDTNYYQDAARGLVPPTEVHTRRDGDRVIVAYNSALAGAEPVRAYHIYAGDKLVSVQPFRPQTTLEPLSVSLPAAEIVAEPVRVVASEASPLPPRMRR